MMQFKTFGGVRYENWGVGFRTEDAAVKEGRSKVRIHFFTHFKVTRSSNPDDLKNPYYLWVYNDPEIVWGRQKKKGFHLDKGLKPLIWELNNRGMYTTDSCTGHGIERGGIFFKRSTANKEVILRIMKKYGLKNIRRENSYSYDNVYFAFDSPTGAKWR